MIGTIGPPFQAVSDLPNRQAHLTSNYGTLSTMVYAPKSPVDLF